jgi:competence protein ComFB
MLAEELLPDIMERFEIEPTEQNRVDILALALNSMPTKYVTSEGGMQYAQYVEVYRVQYELDILNALAKAAMKVKAKPNDTGCMKKSED